MLCLPIERVWRTGTACLRRPSCAGTPRSSAACDMKVTDEIASAPPNEPNIGRKCTGCGVGIEAFGSPIAAKAIMPPLTISDGLTPKNAGFHSTRSASLPGSIEPTSWAMPCAIAGLIVYLAT